MIDLSQYIKFALKVSNPKNHTNPKNPSSDKEEDDIRALSIFASDDIPIVSNPKNPTNPKNPSSDNEDAESGTLSIFASDEILRLALD